MQYNYYLNQTEQELKIRNYSQKTITSYLACLKEYLLYLKNNLKIYDIQNLIAGRNKTDFVFASERGGKLTERTAQKVFANSLKKSQIKRSGVDNLCIFLNLI